MSAIYLTQGLHRARQCTPGKIATISGARRQTFAQFGDRVARLGAALRELGMGAGDRVGMLALNSDRYLEYYLGVPWGGGVVNPCNTRWSTAEIVYSLEDCATRILLVDDHFLHMLPELRAGASLRDVIHVGDGPAPEGLLSYEALLAAAAPMEDARRAGEDLVGVFYTGGTTGYPKGVALTHASIYASSMTLSSELPPGVDQVYLHAAPMFHMADNAAGMLHVIRGSTHAFVPSFTPAATLQAIADARVTSTLVVPTMIGMLVEHPELARYDTSSLTSIMYGASAISEAVLRRALAALPHTSFVQAYGMTELSPVATVLPASRHVFEGPLAGKLRSAGRACLSMEVQILDPEDRQVPRGTVGEICARGPNVMQGYWNQPQLTADTLRGGWMHTGDAGYMDDEGFVFVVDRIKDMIVSGGENVYSAEVENALMKHPAVLMCAVIGVPDDKWGERVHAVLVLRDGETLDDAAVVAHCRTLIATYKCPRSVEVRAALPISGAGKILKKVLRDEHWGNRDRRI